MAVEDDVTRESPAGSPPTTELDPVTAAAGPLAYSEHTGSMPVVDYRPPPRMGWIVALVLVAAGAVAAAMFVLGRSTAPPDVAAPVPASAPVVVKPAPAAQPPKPPPVAPAPEPAQSNPDGIFLQALGENGSVTNSEAAIRTAHQVCDALSRNSTRQVADALQGAHPELSADAISVYINAARVAYCPTVR